MPVCQDLEASGQFFLNMASESFHSVTLLMHQPVTSMEPCWILLLHSLISSHGQYRFRQFWKKRQEQLVKLLPSWEGAAESGIFAENFFLDYFNDDLNKQASDVFRSIGTIVKVHEVIPENNLRGEFLIEGTTGSCIVYFTLTPEKNPLIQEYDIELVRKR